MQMQFCQTTGHPGGLGKWVMQKKDCWAGVGSLLPEDQIDGPQGLTVEITYQLQVSSLENSVGKNSWESHMHSRPVLQGLVQSLLSAPAAGSSCLPAFSQCPINNPVPTSERPTPYLPPCREHWFCLKIPSFWQSRDHIPYTLLHYQSMISIPFPY